LRLLLDTHVVLWWLGDLPALQPAARQLVADPMNPVFVSAASAWEIAIKRALGKLDAPDDLAGAVADAGFSSLPITMDHAHEAGALPPHHADPFDRMLVAQAHVEGLTLLTTDRRLEDYGGAVVVV
jgi:PIN domain nuclease of toxin-antitoxin system